MGLFWAVLDCTGLYWAVLGCTGLYWAVIEIFLAGVNVYRFNAKNWQFTVYFAVITQKIGNFLCILSQFTRFFGVNFILQNFARVKKMTNIRYGWVFKGLLYFGLLI